MSGKAEALAVECPFCWASAGERCYPTAGPRYRRTPKPHAARLRAAEKAREEKRNG